MINHPQEQSFVSLVGQYLVAAERRACPRCAAVGGPVAARCGSAWKTSHRCSRNSGGTIQSVLDSLVRHCEAGTLS